MEISGTFSLTKQRQDPKTQSCCKIALSCFLFFHHLIFSAQLKHINCVRNNCLWLFQSVLTAHSTLLWAVPTKDKLCPWSRAYSVWPSTWNIPMIFCICGYHNEPIFHLQLKCCAKSLSVCLSSNCSEANKCYTVSLSFNSKRTLPSESFLHILSVLTLLIKLLSIIVLILFDFSMSLYEVMTPILHLQKSSLRFLTCKPLLEALKPLMTRFFHK